MAKLRTLLPSNVALLPAVVGLAANLVGWGLDKVWPDAPPLYGWLALVLAGLLFVVAAILWIRELGRFYMPAFTLFQKIFRPDLSAYWNVVEDYDKEVSLNAREFWKYLRISYQKYQSANSNLPRRLDDLVDSAKMPVELPLAFDNNMSKWITDKKGTWSRHSQELLQFAENIYSPSDSGGYKEETDIISSAELEVFDNSRRSLTKVYNKAGIMANDTNEIPAKLLLEKLFPSHTRQIKLLTYLEMALKLALNTPGAGAQGAVKLYRLAEQSGYEIG